MQFRRYIVLLFFLITSIICLNFFRFYDQSQIWLWKFMRAAIARNIQEEISTKQKSQTLFPINISIDKIISERYIYTLTKEIEKRLSTSIGIRVVLNPQFVTFSNITLEGSDFIFSIGANEPIKLAKSSYFFDTWNKWKERIITSKKFVVQPWAKQSDSKLIALTFDDGPSEKYTNTLLDILKKENIRVTFYVLGEKALKNPQILQREYDEGHEIGNHSYSHILFTKLSERMIQEEIYTTDQAVFQTIGIYPHTFRPPYGATNTGMLSILHMPAILWSIDTRDWNHLDILKNTKSIEYAKDGDIIIMHDIHEESVASVPTIIKNLKARGFTFVTISELLSLTVENMQIGKKCTSKWSCK